MQADFDTAMRQRQLLEDDATTTKRKMESANALLSALAGEESRWTEQSKAFDDQIRRLTGWHLEKVCEGHPHGMKGQMGLLSSFPIKLLGRIQAYG